MHAGLDLANEQWGEGESGLRAARNGQALCERELGRERGRRVYRTHTLTESGWTWLSLAVRLGSRVSPLLRLRDSPTLK